MKPDLDAFRLAGRCAAILISSLAASGIAQSQTCDPAFNRVTGSVQFGASQGGGEIPITTGNTCWTSSAAQTGSFSLIVHEPTTGCTFVSGGGLHYFGEPPNGTADCAYEQTPGIICLKCQGSFNFNLYSTKGSFSGAVILMPDAVAPPAGTLVTAEPNGGIRATDSNGFYTFSQSGPGTPSNWGVEVQRPLGSTGPGTGTYSLSSAGSEKVPATTSSARDEVVNLYGLRSGTEVSIRSCPHVGNPVSVATGNVFFDHTDARLPGIGSSLVFDRSYNSMNRGPGRYGIFGSGWSHSYERRIEGFTPGARLLVVRDGNGEAQYFQDSDADNTYRASFPHKDDQWIVAGPDGQFTFHRRSGQRETFGPIAAGGRLLTLVDQIGRTTVLTWSTNRLESIRVPGGRELTLVYDGALLQGLEVDGLRLATYGYFGSRLSSVTYPEVAGVTATGYQFDYESTDPSAPLWRVKDLTGTVIESHAYYGDQKGRTSEITLGVEKYSLLYEPMQTIVTDAKGHVTTYEFGMVWGEKRIKKVTGPCSSCGGGGGAEESFTYDGKGRTLTKTDGEGNLTRFTYDPVTGEVETETRYAIKDNLASAHTTSYTRYPDGLVHTETAPNGQVKTYTYDLGRPKTITTTLNGTEASLVTYDYYPASDPLSPGLLRSMTDPLAKVWKYTYYADGLLKTTEDPLGKTTTLYYDALGRLEKTVLPPTTPPTSPRISTYTRRGALKRITNPDGSNWEHTYDGGGRRGEEHLRTAAGATVRKTVHTPDTFGRPWQVDQHSISADGAPEVMRTEYGYDLMSQIRTIKDARGNVTTFGYDDINRLTTITYPKDSPAETDRVESFTYFANGLVKTKTDRKGVTTTYTYDGLGRLRKKEYSGGTPPVSDPPVTFTYDEAPTAHKGFLTSAALGTNTLAWTYDLAGRMLSETSPLGTLSYSYDLASRRRSAGELTYDYDDAGRPWHVTLGTQQYTLGYDDAGRRRTLSYPTGHVTKYTPDELSRLTDVRTVSGTAVEVATTYPTYDAADNRETRNGDGYTYDLTGRLTVINRSGASYQSYVYDAVGNRSPTGLTPWVYNARNELRTAGSTTLTYDLNGNLSQKVGGGATSIYAWDGENRLRSATTNGNPSAQYEYDPLGRRTRKTMNGLVFKYQYDGEDIYREIDPTNPATACDPYGVVACDPPPPEESMSGGEGTQANVEGGASTTAAVGAGSSAAPYDRVFVHGPGIDEPFGARSTDRFGAIKPSYFLHDGLGSIIAKFAPKDVDPNVPPPTPPTLSTFYDVEWLSYDAFGAFEGRQAEGYSFTGREWDAAVGLYYYRARYYDPKIGRFISEDPIGFAGGYNFYAYVDGNPVNRTDPTGRVSAPVAGGAAAAVFAYTQYRCAENLRQQYYGWSNPLEGSTDPSNRIKHCVVECRISQDCVGGRLTAWFGGLMQDFPGTSQADPDDRTAGARGRCLSQRRKGNCEIDCIVDFNSGAYGR